MASSVENKIGMDFIGDQQRAVFHAKLRHFPQILRPPHQPQRVMGIAQQEDTAILDLGCEIIEIHVPRSIFFHQLVFHHGTAPGFHHIVEFRVDRGLDEDLVPLRAEQLDDGGQGRNNAQAPAHQCGVGLPVVAPDLPLLNGFKITVRTGGIAPDAFLGFCLAGVDDGLGRPEIHVRHPQGDHVARSKLLDALIVFGRTVGAAVDHLIEIVFHRQLLLLSFGRRFSRRLM